MFITLEGPEGSGKSTQAQLLVRYLAEQEIPALLVREPGGTRLGDKVRDIVMYDRDLQISPRAELLLFTVARAQLVEEVIRPQLSQGMVVVCDRYADSTVAYQGYGRGLDIPEIQAINHFTTGGLVPDLTLLLDVPPEVGLLRSQKRQLTVDRFELEDIDFHRRVREGYLALAQAEPGRWEVVDATQPVEDVWEQIRAIVASRLTR